MFRLLFTLNLAVVLAAPGARAAESIRPAAGPPSTATNQQMFQVKGLVLEIKPQEKSVKIKHEDIPGYMKSMTMDFDVKDTNELAGIEPGDPVSFRVIVTDTYGWIDQIRKTGPKRNDPPTTGHFRLVRDVEPLNEGDLLPAYQFTNQFGKIFSTKDFKGQALAITFLFTRCPFPTFCPLMANNFNQVQGKLLARTNGPTNWHLVTISFDPEYDTPEVLKAYGEAHRYDPKHWTFATGPLIDITAIGEQFGLVVLRDDTGGINHNLRTVVVDTSGRVRKVFIGNQWTPDELVAEMVKAAAK